MRNFFVAVIASLVALASGTAQAEKRVALVVGNTSYVNVPRLANPVNDARLMAETLRAIGFSLVGDGAQLDLDEAGLRRAVQGFGEQLQGADVGLFYYAGHGVQVRGANYLVPIGANPVKEADVDFQMLDTNLVLRQMESAGTRLNLVILDACRNNPFGGRGLRATDSGLAQMRAPQGTLISFATQPGNVALDGSDGNSPYTRALAQVIRRPGLDIFQTFNEVGLAVHSSTGGAQQPWLSSSPIAGSFYFAGLPAASSATLPQSAPSEAAQAWAVTRDTTSLAVLEAFIRRFEGTPYADFARARLDELKKSQTAVVAPPVQPPTTPDTTPKPAVGIFPSASGATPLLPERERALKPKDSFKECDLCPEMVVVPSGSFTMGSPANEKGRGTDEGPQHTVTFAKAFAVGKFEVTVGQFAAFVKETGHATASKCMTEEGGKSRERFGRSWREPGFYQTDAHPAVCINWDDAKAYVAWLAKQTGKPYRLLSELEWEYVARAGTTTPFWWGSTNTSTRANYNGNWFFLRQRGGTMHYDVDKKHGEHRGKTVPVDTFSPNEWGLYQVHGNAEELVEDCYHENYRGAPTDGSAWTAGDCTSRVARGGNWMAPSHVPRSAFRSSNSNDTYSAGTGFRVARTLTP